MWLRVNVMMNVKETRNSRSTDGGAQELTVEKENILFSKHKLIHIMYSLKNMTYRTDFERPCYLSTQFVQIKRKKKKNFKIYKIYKSACEGDGWM